MYRFYNDLVCLFFCVFHSVASTLRTVKIFQFSTLNVIYVNKLNLFGTLGVKNNSMEKPGIRTFQQNLKKSVLLFCYN